MKTSDFLAQRPVFTTEEFQGFQQERGSHSQWTRKALLAHYQKQQRIIRLRRGVYAAVPPGATPDDVSVDPYLVASKLAPDAVLGYRVPLWPVVRRNSRRLASHQAKGIPILDVHELGAGKLAALFSRRASRDLFDAHGLVCGNESLDWNLLRVGFLVYGAMNRKDWRTIRLEDLTFDRRDFEDELPPVLRHLDTSISLNEFAERLRTGCREKLAPLLAFTKRERGFLDRLLDHGEIVPELLTADAALAARIAAHPMLQWKALNVKQHKKKA
jgi:hypothetical protein